MSSGYLAYAKWYTSKVTHCSLIYNSKTLKIALSTELVIWTKCHAFSGMLYSQKKEWVPWIFYFSCFLILNEKARWRTMCKAKSGGQEYIIMFFYDYMHIIICLWRCVKYFCKDIPQKNGALGCPNDKARKRFHCVCFWTFYILKYLNILPAQKNTYRTIWKINELANWRQSNR